MLCVGFHEAHTQDLYMSVFSGKFVHHMMHLCMMAEPTDNGCLSPNGQDMKCNQNL